jgi:hypothetical protein
MSKKKKEELTMHVDNTRLPTIVATESTDGVVISIPILKKHITFLCKDEGLSWHITDETTDKHTPLLSPEKSIERILECVKKSITQCSADEIKKKFPNAIILLETDSEEFERSFKKIQTKRKTETIVELYEMLQTVLTKNGQSITSFDFNSLAKGEKAFLITGKFLDETIRKYSIERRDIDFLLCDIDQLLNDMASMSKEIGFNLNE